MSFYEKTPTDELERIMVEKEREVYLLDVEYAEIEEDCEMPYYEKEDYLYSIKDDIREIDTEIETIQNIIDERKENNGDK